MSCEQEESCHVAAFHCTSAATVNVEEEDFVAGFQQVSGVEYSSAVKEA